MIYEQDCLESINGGGWEDDDLPLKFHWGSGVRNEQDNSLRTTTIPKTKQHVGNSVYFRSYLFDPSFGKNTGKMGML